MLKFGENNKSSITYSGDTITAIRMGQKEFMYVCLGVVIVAMQLPKIVVIMEDADKRFANLKKDLSCATFTQFEGGLRE